MTKEQLLALCSDLCEVALKHVPCRTSLEGLQLPPVELELGERLPFQVLMLAMEAVVHGAHPWVSLQDETMLLHHHRPD